MGQFTLSRDPDLGLRLILSGDLDIRSVQSLHEQLTEQLATAPGLTIDCAAVDGIDGAILQWLWAVRRHCAASRITLRWQGVAPSLALTLANSGSESLCHALEDDDPQLAATVR